MPADSEWASGVAANAADEERGLQKGGSKFNRSFFLSKVFAEIAKVPPRKREGKTSVSNALTPRAIWTDLGHLTD